MAVQAIWNYIQRLLYSPLNDRNSGFNLLILDCRVVQEQDLEKLFHKAANRRQYLHYTSGFHLSFCYSWPNPTILLKLNCLLCFSAWILIFPYHAVQSCHIVSKICWLNFVCWIFYYSICEYCGDCSIRIYISIFHNFVYFKANNNAFFTKFVFY